VETPVWVPRLVVDSIHFEQLNEHGGSHGVRDERALESALARPQHKHAYEADADLAYLAAAYAFGIARSHPFVDGNKRTAFVVAAIFLGLNGYEIEATDEDVEQTVMRLADGKLSEKKLAEWIRKRMKATPSGEKSNDLTGD
jgi:death-on-curing protein